MIIFEDKGFQTNSLFPNEDWTGKAKYVVDDNSELARKIIQLYPNYDFVVENGILVDVIEVECAETEETEQPVSEIEQLRADIDYIAIMTGVEL